MFQLCTRAANDLSETQFNRHEARPPLPVTHRKVRCGLLSASAVPNALPLLKGMMMRRLTKIFATATLVLGMLTAVAEAHGGGPMGGLGASHTLHQLSTGYRVHNGHEPNCYVPEEFPKYPPWPPFCS